MKCHEAFAEQTCSEAAGGSGSWRLDRAVERTIDDMPQVCTIAADHVETNTGRLLPQPLHKRRQEDNSFEVQQTDPYSCFGARRNEPRWREKPSQLGYLLRQPCADRCCSRSQVILVPPPDQKSIAELKPEAGERSTHRWLACSQLDSGAANMAEPEERIESA